MATINPTTNPEPIAYTQRIGSTLYRVNARFSGISKDTLEGKILRLLKNDLQTMSQNGTIESLQACRLPERG